MRSDLVGEAAFVRFSWKLRGSRTVGGIVVPTPTHTPNTPQQSTPPTPQAPHQRRGAPLPPIMFALILVPYAWPLRSHLQVWIFVGLNKADPAAAVTLRQMDRH